MVNKERVQLLVEALRSGRYQQGRGQLLNDGLYCCLGVACEVAAENGLPLRREVNEFDRDVTFGTDSDFAGMGEDYAQLPWSVQAWYGFEDQDPELRGDLSDYDEAEDYICPASSWNDDYHRNFDQIADLFENTFLRDTEETAADANA
jgi:hypothetical protein